MQTKRKHRNLKELTKNKKERKLSGTNNYSKVLGHKVNIQKSIAFIYTSSE